MPSAVWAFVIFLFIQLSSFRQVYSVALHHCVGTLGLCTSEWQYPKEAAHFWGCWLGWASEGHFAPPAAQAMGSSRLFPWTCHRALDTTGQIAAHHAVTRDLGTPNPAVSPCSAPPPRSPKKLFQPRGMFLFNDLLPARGTEPLASSCCPQAQIFSRAAIKAQLLP